MEKSRKKRVSYNLNHKFMTEQKSVRDEAMIREKIKSFMLGSIKPEDGRKPDYEYVDYLICRPEGYTRRIMTHGSIGRMIDLCNEFQSFLGVKEVREVFRNWLKVMNLTISSVSNCLFPDKSQSYLSTMLNSDNKKTYPDELVNDTFLKAKAAVEKGILKVDGVTIQDLALQVADELDDTKTDNHQKKGIKKGVEKSMVKEINNKKVLIITNYEKRKQEMLEVNAETYKELNDFYKKLVGVGAIENKVEIKPIEL
ncbi:hypothetical protein [Enterococcus gallinarum]|uniref:hypothetical protein n=1 Tax=Enterococcus gallinarum TaxID=1353 RepID=UPI001EAA70FC|nr:hypothetical protein [Enterococcus gallinarum]BCU41205.1 hypothetical protein [Bacteriophage sp.]GMG58876.1 hypothetical protein AH4_22740 [Enterococcus gallinarum]